MGLQIPLHHNFISQSSVHSVLFPRGQCFWKGGGGSVHPYVEGSEFSAFHITKATQCFNLPCSGVIGCSRSNVPAHQAKQAREPRLPIEFYCLLVLLFLKDAV